MVGLCDIPCVGKVVDRISDAAVDPIFRGFRYMFCYKDLVKILDSEVEKANTVEDRVSTKVAAERANGKLIKPHVLEWQKEAGEIRESAKEFTEKYKNRHSWMCIQCLPIPNPIPRFQLGREAAQKTKTVTEHISSGEKLLANEIAHLPPDENLPKSKTEFQDFQSRKDAYAELWKALVTDSSQILGIYGMPGVGKTRMMEQLWKEAKEKKIFNKVTRGNVGNKKLDVVQIIELQKKIAEHLDCHFDPQDNVVSRASQLKRSLLNSLDLGKTLVILDDVWSEIPLDDIGIPMGCKILLTSREEDVCLSNKCTYLVKITPLSDDEAWDLFKSIVGIAKLKSLQDESLAKKVCDKCGGLPLLIHAISKALQFGTRNSWVDALQQLEKGKFDNIPGVHRQVYACIKLSIDKLPDDAKSCLFLCCLFPEDADISVTKLIQLATGSQLVSDGEYRVLSMVDTLRFASLLLDCEDNDIAKLHDIIRDVGRSEAVRDKKYAFLQVRCGLQLPDADFGSRKLLCLDLESDNVHFPGDLVCPYLHSLWLKCNNRIQKFSDGFFSMSANLRFLYVQGEVYSGPEQQLSLQPLGKLRTLILEDCDLNKKNVGFFPKNLETLCIWGYDPVDLSYLLGDDFLPEPLDLSYLKHLQKLEIKGQRFKIIPNNISSLSSLKELHVPNGFEIWGEGSETDSDEPILVEISQLPHLTSLQIRLSISDILLNRSDIVQVTTIFNNLQNFNICVSPYPQNSNNPFKKSIELYGSRIEEVFERLIERAEFVKLECTDNMEHLARMLPGEIQHSQRPSFSKLTCLEIINCSALKYLFCNSVAKCLTQLQNLKIVDCRVMEAVVMNEGSSNGDIINFSNLKELKLGIVPRLRSFHREKKDSMISSVQLQAQALFDGMVEFPSLENLKIYGLKAASDIWERDFNDDNNGSSFCKLKSLSVYRCDKLETVIPVGMLYKLQNLQHLEISCCSLVTSEVGTYASNTDVFPLLALSHMSLDELPCLEETWLNSRNRSVAMTLYPNLKKLEINNCNSMRNVFLHSSSFARDVMHLEEIEVKKCKMMREIIGGKGELEEITHIVVFPELTILQLHLLPNLSSFWCYPDDEEANASKVEFPNLVNFKLSSCAKINLEAIEFTCQLNSLDISCDNEIQLPCKWQPRLHNLETLILSRCWWYELKSVCFPRLKVLQVQSSGCSALFAFSGFKSLQQLERITITHCGFLEEIVEGDEISGMNKKTITLSHLKDVVLKDLPKLKSFFRSANYDCYMPALWYMRVDNCGFSTLFTYPVFRNLQILRHLEVSYCRLLEVIVEDARGDETSDTNDKTITLPKLRNIELNQLPNLKSFSPNQSYAFHMPELEFFSLLGCPRVENFPCLNTNTRKGHVETDTGGHYQEFEVGDLNDYINDYINTL